MIAAVVVILLVVWLVIGLTSGSGDDNDAPSDSSTTSAAPTSSEEAAPSSVEAVALPQVLCMGQSYAMLEPDLTTDEMLADPAALEEKYPGSILSTIPAGCIADSTERDQVVLALGPFPSLAEACAAGTEAEVKFTAYEGSADTGLTAAACPGA
ncbi:hypothetical protein [Cumulibacter soli]|uniref:hypothetical protein n=1 Tax=Cumulibacter soli TaxID=2546344 RepID=UPI001068801E|nr:hypothetical protein [Cumulibacter soli]